MCKGLGIPVGQQLPGYPEGGILPLAFVADAAFPLREDLLQPYAALWQGNMDEPEKMFNYRLSRACRVVENAFGILSQCFRMYHHTLDMTHGHTVLVVQASTVLHNFIMQDVDMDISNVKDKDIKSCTGGMLKMLSPLSGNTATLNGAKTRHTFRDYFLTDVGRVKWQSEYAHVNLANRRYNRLKVK